MFWVIPKYECCVLTCLKELHEKVNAPGFNLNKVNIAHEKTLLALDDQYSVNPIHLYYNCSRIFEHGDKTILSNIQSPEAHGTLFQSQILYGYGVQEVNHTVCDMLHACLIRGRPFAIKFLL